MCGIAGYYAKEGADQSQLKLVAAIAGIEMVNRGSQSWGTLDDQDHVVRGLGSLSSGISFPLVMPQSYVMHTRFGTHGGNTIENAHPFIQGRVIGVHNGVIGNHEELNRLHNRIFQVDSQHIFQHIDEGLFGLNDIAGYGAIVYRFEGRWFIGTFNHGSMEVANTPLGKIFASTQFAVERACRFAGVNIDSWDTLADNVIYEMTPDGLVSRFEVAAHGTTRKWDDGSGDVATWWRGLKKKDGESSCDVSPSEETGLLLRKFLENSRRRRSLALTAGAAAEGLVVSPHVGQMRDAETLWQEHGITAEAHVEAVEHDESGSGFHCVHCFMDCADSTHYLNKELDPVCPGCASGIYAFVAEDEYYSVLNMNRWPTLKCELCNEDGMARIINLIDEDMKICHTCFLKNYTTKGLTKISN